MHPALVNMAAIPTSVFATAVVGVSTNPIYLRVWFNDGVKGFERLVPDQRVGAVSFAMAAATMADGSVTIEKLAPDLLAALQSANNPILQVATLQSQINALSNRLEHTVTLSLEPGDPALLSQGLSQFAKLDAPGWKNGSSANAPLARIGNTGVWSGTHLLIWGGTVVGAPSASGGEYDPSGDSWSLISTVNAPAARSGHAAVWTGDRMLLWGGFGSSYLGTGGAYSPASLAWSALATNGAPAGRDGHVGVWTGARLLIWGGLNGGGLLADGSSYDLTGGAWTPLPVPNAPSARHFPTAVWANDRMIIFGGQGAGGAVGTGAALPFTGGITPGVWQTLPALNAPSARSGHTAVWTGSKMLIWGGAAGGTLVGNGAAYDPSTDSWAVLGSVGAPTARFGHVAVWTGSEMLVFGGETAAGPVSNGAAYNPSNGKWRPLSELGSPLARTQGSGVWSGTELLVFSGLSSTTPSISIASLQRLNPQPTSYLYSKP